MTMTKGTVLGTQEWLSVIRIIYAIIQVRDLCKLGFG